jgi:hypothetical protein
MKKLLSGSVVSVCSVVNPFSKQSNHRRKQLRAFRYLYRFHFAESAIKYAPRTIVVV